MELKHYIEERTALTNRELKSFLPRKSTRPTSLHEAMHYSLFAGGKRLRPVLCMAACEACGGETRNAIGPACAIECVHTYSLIHDDLPCMDDDDFRRGRPTCHKVFGEAVALLAGDALLTLAFEILSRPSPGKSRHKPPKYPPETFLLELATAAGSRNLIAGQVADMEAEGRPVTREQLRFIHRGKTSAMLSLAMKLGAMSADATPKNVRLLADFGTHLGMAFQVVDDILDVTQSSEALGKSAGKDVVAGKATYPSLLGLDGAVKEAARLTSVAIRTLAPLGPKGKTLETLARQMLHRSF